MSTNKKWKITDEQRRKIEQGLTVLLEDHVAFINGTKDKKEYPSFQSNEKSEV